MLYLKASLNHYKGFTNNESCSRLEKMILVSLCSRIMNVSSEYYDSRLPVSTVLFNL